MIYTDNGPIAKSKIFNGHEKRERKLREIISKKQKPVVLFIDEAHDLHSKTLIGLKRLMELIGEENESSLSIVLTGHPKLANCLSQSKMEEIGARTEVFEYECFSDTEEKRKYIEWIINKSLKSKGKLKDIIQDDATKLLCELLTTPLQIEQHLRLAFEKAHKIAQPIVDAELIRAVVAKDINDVEPKLTRLGYSPKILSDILNIKPVEVKHFLSGKLSEDRTNELQNNLRYIGIPI